MQTLEADSSVIQFPAATPDTPPAVKPGNYQAVRFNAMRHGILSGSAVLPHEDAGEFSDLLAALVEEHQPAGATERHLVEALAACMWRQRRVLVAENAAINRGLQSVTASKINSPAPAAVPFERGLSVEPGELQDLMTEEPESIAERQRDTAAELAATEKARAILHRGGARAYERACRALLPDSLEWWQEKVEEEEYPATAEGLADFITNDLWPLSWRLAQEAKHAEAIKAQTLGEGLHANRLEKLNRYEVHLDRKFERTLAMLLKLKEMRKA